MARRDQRTTVRSIVSPLACSSRLDDADEQAWLEGVLGPSTWLGLSDQATDGDWVWEVSEQTATYTNWAGGEPANTVLENCASLESTSFWISSRVSVGGWMSSGFFKASLSRADAEHPGVGSA